MSKKYVSQQLGNFDRSEFYDKVLKNAITLEEWVEYFSDIKVNEEDYYWFKGNNLDLFYFPQVLDDRVVIELCDSVEDLRKVFPYFDINRAIKDSKFKVNTDEFMVLVEDYLKVFPDFHLWHIHGNFSDEFIIKFHKNISFDVFVGSAVFNDRIFEELGLTEDAWCDPIPKATTFEQMVSYLFSSTNSLELSYKNLDKLLSLVDELGYKLYMVNDSVVQQLNYETILKHVGLLPSSVLDRFYCNNDVKDADKNYLQKMAKVPYSRTQHYWTLNRRAYVKIVEDEGG